MSQIGPILTTALTIYALVTAIFLISENRRPQSTLAWMLAFIFAPGLGVLLYFLVGRDRKAFSRQNKLLRQDLEFGAFPFLAPILPAQESARDAEIAQLESENPAYTRMMMLVRRNSRSPLTRNNDVTIQQDAARFYPSLIADLKAARHSIHLQYFIWRTDAFTEELAGILAAKAREGVEVRLLFDPVGSLALATGRGVRRMRDAGIRVAPTSPLYRLHTISYRNHRKITVIDGRIGYTGGMNIGQEHLEGHGWFDFWRDTQLRIVGGGVPLLQAVFMVDWYNATGENLLCERYFGARRQEPAENGVPLQIVTSGPDSEWAAIRQLYAFMIVSARRRVFLQSPFFIPDATIAEALTTAALSGVDVRLMVSVRADSNRLPDWAGNTFLADVADAGVRVFLYKKGYLHAKTITVDSEICSVGSANIDIRSFSINYELNAVIYDARLTRELERDFERDLADCVEFTAEDYRRRTVALRFRDSVTRLCAPLL